jgi:flagellar assembly protein FliH
VISKAKFLFDQDFGPFADPAEKPIAPADHTIKLAEAESRGFRDGFEAAEREAAALAARRTVVALEQIGDALNRLARDLTNIERRIEDEAIELAVTVARKLAPELVSREPLAEVCALGTECFRQLADAPHVVVHVSETLLGEARTRLEDIARARGFEGRLMVIAEPEIALGDCRIEWADGGMIRNRAQTDRAIEVAIGRYLGAR